MKLEVKHEVGSAGVKKAADLFSTLFRRSRESYVSHEARRFALKQDLIELTLHAAMMNGYAEGTAYSLRGQGDMPTSETLVDYVKTMTFVEMFPNAEAPPDRILRKPA